MAGSIASNAEALRSEAMKALIVCPKGDRGAAQVESVVVPAATAAFNAETTTGEEPSCSATVAALSKSPRDAAMWRANTTKSRTLAFMSAELFKARRMLIPVFYTLGQSKEETRFTN